MLKVLEPWHTLPAGLISRLDNPVDSLKEPECLQAINRAVEGLPCSLLPDGRSDASRHLQYIVARHVCVLQVLFCKCTQAK